MPIGVAALPSDRGSAQGQRRRRSARRQAQLGATRLESNAAAESPPAASSLTPRVARPDRQPHAHGTSNTPECRPRRLRLRARAGRAVTILPGPRDGGRLDAAGASGRLDLRAAIVACSSSACAEPGSSPTRVAGDPRAVRGHRVRVTRCGRDGQAGERLPDLRSRAGGTRGHRRTQGALWHDQRRPVTAAAT